MKTFYPVGKENFKKDEKSCGERKIISKEDFFSGG